MAVRFRELGDGSAGEASGAHQTTGPMGSNPVLVEGRRWRRPHLLLFTVVVVLLVALPSCYILSQDESRTTPYTISVTTSCPRGVWSPPAPGELTGACSYLGFLDLPSVSKLFGSYVASNSSPLWVVVGFRSGSYNSTSSSGSFALVGTAPFTWASAPWPIGWGDPPTAAAITVVSNYPITVTFEGTYCSPLFA